MKQNKLVHMSFALGLVAVPTLTLAAETPAKPAVPTLGDILDASGITMSGYIDAGYNYLSTAKGSNTFRAFDTEKNSFDLHQFALTIAKQPKEGFGGLLNITAGEDAKITKSFGWDTNNLDITQGYVSYAGGPLTVIAGKFATLAGAELITSPSNPNISHSLLFTYGPYTHTGLRATYAMSDTVSFIAGINNGWDQLKDANSNKTLELGVTATPNKMFSLAATGYSGVEPRVMSASSSLPPGPQGNRTLLDLVGTINATDSLTFILNYDVASQVNATATGGKAKWNTVVGYVNYAINEQWRTSFRAESFDDKDGYRLLGDGVKRKVKDYTLTVAYMPTKSTELRVEARQDKSDQLDFTGSNGALKKEQVSYAVQALYKF